jgi:predicted XRE-type DNA-binding protein
MTKRSEEKLEKVTTSSGNIFADLGLPHSEEDMLKVKIAHAIALTVKERNLTQSEAAKIIGTDQAKVSALFRGRLEGFSIDRLFLFLVMLGRDVDIRISKKLGKKPGRLRVSNAA